MSVMRETFGMDQRIAPTIAVLDASGSMAEDNAIQSESLGWSNCIDSLQNTPDVRESIWVSEVIVTTEPVYTALTPLIDYVTKQLTAQGTTRFDLALDAVYYNILTQPPIGRGGSMKVGTHRTGTIRERSIRSRSIQEGSALEGAKTHYRPQMFVITDGYPTDQHGNPDPGAWKDAADRIHNLPTAQRPVIYGFGCGPKADLNMLDYLCHPPAHRDEGQVYSISEMSKDMWANLFKLMSGSIAAASRSVQAFSAAPPTAILDPSRVTGMSRKITLVQPSRRFTQI